MRNKNTPIKQWLEANRWPVATVAESVGLTRQTVYNHINGKSFLSEAAVSAYKRFGVPAGVIRDHISWLVKRA